MGGNGGDLAKEKAGIGNKQVKRREKPLEKGCSKTTTQYQCSYREENNWVKDWGTHH